MNSEANNNINKNKKYIRIVLNVLSVILFLAIIGWGVIVYFHLNKNQFTDDAQVESYINPISVRIPGYIKEIRFEENQPVKKGDTLVIIDDREYKIQVEQAMANLKDVEAGKTVVTSDVSVAANNTAVSDANLAEAKARLDNQYTNLQRYKNLLQADVVSQFQYDQIKTEYDAMKAKYSALESQRKGTRLATQSTSDRLTVSDASIERAKAALDLAKLNLSYCYVIAPYDGIMGRRKISEGQLMQAGQPLATIVQDNDKWVVANYTESQISNIKVGDKVSIKVDALKGKKFEGEVNSISGATGSRYSAVPVDNSTGNFVKVQQRIPVRILFTKNNKVEDLQLVRAGMNVEVSNK